MFFYFRRPQSKFKRSGIDHTIEPDLDNLVEAFKGACKSILCEDDSQVSQYLEPFGKYYTLDQPRLELILAERKFMPIQAVDSNG